MNTRSIDRSRSYRWMAPAGLAVLVLCSLAWGVRAQLGSGQNNGTPEVITYRGYLEDSSTGTATAVNGTRAMDFRIYGSPTNDGSAALWTCAGVNVNVVGGNFEVLLGAAPCPAFPSTPLFNNPNLYLEVAVGGVVLNGRQRLTAAPYAMAAAQANNFKVFGNLTAGGLSVSGTTTLAGTVAANQGLSVSGGSLQASSGVSTTTISASGTVTAPNVSVGGVTVYGDGSGLHVSQPLLRLGNWYSVSNNGPDIDMPEPISVSVCFLTASIGSTSCNVFQNGALWRLEQGGTGSCTATCMRWN